MGAHTEKNVLYMYNTDETILAASTSFHILQNKNHQISLSDFCMSDFAVLTKSGAPCDCVVFAMGHTGWSFFLKPLRSLMRYC